MPERHFDRSYRASAPESYERYFVPAIGRPLAVELVRAAALRAGERVLDAGCGTGVVARLAAEEVMPGGLVVGLDVNPGMLRVAADAAGAESAVEWHEASIEAMPLDDGAFDVVLCQMSLQFVADRHEGLREMHRVLKPGGRLALNLPGPIPEPLAALRDALGRQVDGRAAGFVAAVFAIHDTTEIERSLLDAGFDGVSVEGREEALRLPPPAEFLWQYVESTPLGAMVAAAGDSARERLEREVLDRWRDHDAGDSMTLPLRVVTATGRR